MSSQEVGSENPGKKRSRHIQFSIWPDNADECQFMKWFSAYSGKLSFGKWLSNVFLFGKTLLDMIATLVKPGKRPV